MLVDVGRCGITLPGSPRCLVVAEERAGTIRRADDPVKKQKRKRKRLGDRLDETMNKRFAAPAEEILRGYFEENIELLQKLAEEVEDGKASKAIKQQWAKKVSLKWQERSTHIKTRVVYSDRQWMRLKNMLSANYMALKDKFIKFAIDGVYPPELASLRYIRDEATKHQTDLGIMSVDKGASMSMTARLEKVIRSLVTQGLLSNDHAVWLQFAGDGCSMGQIGQAAIAFRLMGLDGVDENSPFSTYTVLLFEGDDGYTAVSQHISRLVKDMEELQENGLQVDGRHFTFRFWGGGDLKFINGMLGLSTCAHTYGCPWCLVNTTSELHEPSSKKFKARTLARCQAMAHHRTPSQLTPFAAFTCLGCQVHFTSKKQLEGAEPTTEGQRQTLQKKHEGQRFGSPPLLPISPRDWIMCILHVMLRLVDGLFAHTVKAFIKTREREEKINAVLKGMGIHVKKLKKTKEQIKIQALKEVKLHGRNCKKMLGKVTKAADRLAGYRVIIDAMDYEEGGGMTKDKAIALWKALGELIDELSDGTWDQPGDMHDSGKQEERAARARKATELADNYIRLFQKEIGAEHVTLYMHACAHHAPLQIERVGSLSRWSMQALEHCNSLRKKNWRVACNRKMKGMQPRQVEEGRHPVYHAGVLHGYGDDSTGAAQRGKRGIARKD